ncbi:efflux transporter outer membrane subunit [Pseudomonas sp. Hp2]|uniref:efflux transporter outer membrane subunit n=1 Tax=Pseudomonas sp. Hp2 TaxID=701189 RepID=UPI0011291758|nr:TolC family protein [Pseudomonas sp. Hp2]
MTTRSPFRPLLLPAALPLLLSACMLGPDYVKPDVAGDALAQARLPRADPAVVADAPPPRRWWEALDDAQLTWLVEQALAHSPDLRAAEANVSASRALVRQRRAERMPSVGATAGYVHARMPDAIVDAARSTPQLQGTDLDNVELYTAAFDASWELDLFGRRRRAQQEAQAQAEADEAQLADAQVQLAAEVGRAYANYRGTQERLAIARDSRDKAAKMLELTRQRRERGAAPQTDVERALAQLRQQEASIPDLQATLQESLDQLALMTGRVPGALDAALAEPRPLPQLPAVVPVDDAASLIRRRPDVRRAERQLAASSAKIGQALSGYFPQVTLLGGIGMGATSPGDLGSDAVGTVVAPILRWSVFDFGKTRSQVAQARAGNQAYAASYEAKVLAALQDANNALARFGASRRALAMAGDAADAATRSSDLVQQRYRAGATSLIDALDVQRQQLSARDSRTQAQMKLLVDYIGLQKSLGLGWQAPEQAAAR